MELFRKHFDIIASTINGSYITLQLYFENRLDYSDYMRIRQISDVREASMELLETLDFLQNKPAIAEFINILHKDYIDLCYKIPNFIEGERFQLPLGNNRVLTVCVSSGEPQVILGEYKVNRHTIS